MSEPATTADSGRRAPWNRLAFRLGLGLFLGAAAILFFVERWNLGLQREKMTALVSTSAARIVETIQRSTRSAMLRNDPEETRRILSTIGAQEGVERIRIFDKQGRIRMSTRAGEVGRMVDKAAEQCYACHKEGQPLARLDRPDRVRIFSQGGHRVLGEIFPIRNEPACTLTCHTHSPDKTILGVLDVQLSLRAVDRYVEASERQLGLGLLVAVGAVFLLATFLVWKMVLRPVKLLIQGMDRVGEGDFDVQVPVPDWTEIGALAVHWNRMVDELARMRAALEEWSATLERRVEKKARELEAAHDEMMMVEKMASLGKLSAIVAHEINNPLAGIGTYARLLGKRIEKGVSRGGADDDTPGILKMIEEEAGRCGKIVKNLLLFSRTPAACLTDTELPAVIERCVLLIRHQADLQEVVIEKRIDPALPRIQCDASQIQQVMLVLLMNAVEAMPTGGTLTIDAHPAAGGDGVEVVIRDTGCGIPEKNLSRIFEPFFSTKDQVRGCGLGLAVAYGIVNRHHGSIHAQSKPGRGTTMTVRLPLRQPAADGVAVGTS